MKVFDPIFKFEGTRVYIVWRLSVNGTYPPVNYERLTPSVPTVAFDTSKSLWEFKETSPLVGLVVAILFRVLFEGRNPAPAI